jgi:ribosomal-protein-alanine N-acetyltransferase
MDEIQTTRTRLRQFTLDDLDDLARIFANPSVMLYLGLEGKPLTREETETCLLSMIRHWERHGFGRWAVECCESGKLIGCAGLRSHENTAELVYLLDEPFWGCGLATEIAANCLRYGFERHNFERIVAFTRPANAASRRVLEKIGMAFTGEAVIYGVNVVAFELSQRDFYDKSPHPTIFPAYPPQSDTCGSLSANRSVDRRLPPRASHPPQFF